MFNVIIESIVAGVTAAGMAVGGAACTVGTTVRDTTVCCATAVADATITAGKAVGDFGCTVGETVYTYSPWGVHDKCEELERRLEELERSQEETIETISGNVIYWD